MFQKELNRQHHTQRRPEEENFVPRVNLPATLFNRSPQKLINNSHMLTYKKAGARNGGDSSPLRKQHSTLAANRS